MASKRRYMQASHSSDEEPEQELILSHEEVISNDNNSEHSETDSDSSKCTGTSSDSDIQQDSDDEGSTGGRSKSAESSSDSENEQDSENEGSTDGRSKHTESSSDSEPQDQKDSDSSSAYCTESDSSSSEDELPNHAEQSKEIVNSATTANSELDLPPTEIVNPTTSTTSEQNPKKTVNQEEQAISDRVKEMKKVLDNFEKALRYMESSTPQATNRESGRSQDSSSEAPRTQRLHPNVSSPPPMNREAGSNHNSCTELPRPQCSYPNVRPEHIRRFPDGVRPNKMWAEWYDFIEHFEVSLSLYNTTDPSYKTKLLYLSLGQELQAIVNAADLRPVQEDANCYTTFVRNIENHLRSMTDTAAEHRAFLRMKQDKDESTVAFHARLMRNVKLCGYSASDLNRFVRAQLLDGMRNKELVKAARIYGHDTSFIVQSATRDEAYEAETVEPPADPSAFAISEGYRPGAKRSYPQQWSSNRDTTKKHRANPDYSQMQDRQRTASDRVRQQPRASRENLQSQDQGGRCPRCNNTFHRNRICPALSRKCSKCSKRGHFAAVCQTRLRRVQQIEQNSRYSDFESSGEEAHTDSKQVKQQ